uniref:Restriction endonuclease S subunit n=1 Tax=Aerococcus viridans TaxID=1377 RepID=A0A8F3IXF4_9LACT|nr:restriction endonuclease subunit S [Aerococcus viridans]QWY91678.1 Restriction endonuclease S subunit [Aerococcus viridans]
MSINKDSQKAPNLRFKGFTDDWEQRKASELFKSISDKKHPNLPVLSASQEKGMILRDDIGIDIKYDHKSLSNYKRVTPGQFVIHLRSFQGGFADSQIEGITSPAYTVIDFKEKDQSHSLFWKEILTSQSFIKRLETVTYGIRDGRSISFSDFSTLKFLVPKLDEQEKIAVLFKTLDQTITLHQRKLDQLKQLKEALLQQMFPGKGETVPNLRFAGFEGDWEELKLSAVVDKQIKGKAQADKLNPGNVEYLDTARLNGGEPLLTDGISNVMKDDILILWDGSKAGTVYIGFEGALGSTLKAYRTNSDSQFVFQYLKRYQEHIYNNYRTPNIPHVQKDFLEVFTIKVPTMKEQTKIGNTLKHLDDTITLQQRKLDQLQDIKQVLLENMFI